MRAFFKPTGVRTMVAATALLICSGSAFATDVRVKLIGAEETPPVTTSAKGTGTITIGADKSVTGTIKTKGIEGTVAHILVGDPAAAEIYTLSLDQCEG